MQDAIPGFSVLVIGGGLIALSIIINAIFNSRFNGASGAFWVALLTTIYHLFWLIGDPNFIVRALAPMGSFAIPLALFAWMSQQMEKRRLREEEQMTGAYVHNPNNPIYPGTGQPQKVEPVPSHGPGGVVALVLTLAVIGAGAWFLPPLVKQYTQPATTKPTNAATLVIKSAPAGAEVTVDTLAKGKTPVTLNDLFAGEVLDVRVQHGKKTARKKVQLKPGENVVDLQLEP